MDECRYVNWLLYLLFQGRGAVWDLRGIYYKYAFNEPEHDCLYMKSERGSRSLDGPRQVYRRK